EARAQNAIEQLRALEREGRRFDVVVLDPPAFAKRREGLEGALRAYREINYRGVRLLAPGGLLVTCSCSGKVTPQIFGEVIEWAASGPTAPRARRSVPPRRGSSSTPTRARGRTPPPPWDRAASRRRAGSRRPPRRAERRAGRADRR